MIVTHTNPDLDAITGVWLLHRFGGLAGEPVEFVNTGNPDAEKMRSAVAVVDTGRQSDSSNLRFDHHHLPGQAANDTCAAKQVYDYIWYCRYNDAGGHDTGIDHLNPLIDLVFAGDTGRDGADASREMGLHAIFAGWKAWWAEQNPDDRLPDLVALAYGFGLLDVLEVRLRKQAEARAELEEKTVYKSADNLVWAIRHGSSGSTFAAADRGARLVVFEGEPIEVEGGTTYPIGIMRPGESQEPHAGNLALVAAEADPELAAEIATWFRHPSGFFTGRGTAKAPVFEPVEINLVALARAVDAAWQRTMAL